MCRFNCSDLQQTLIQSGNGQQRVQVNFGFRSDSALILLSSVQVWFSLGSVQFKLGSAQFGSGSVQFGSVQVQVLPSSSLFFCQFLRVAA